MSRIAVEVVVINVGGELAEMLLSVDGIVNLRDAMETGKMGYTVTDFPNYIDESGTTVEGSGFSCETYTTINLRELVFLRSTDRGGYYEF